MKEITDAGRVIRRTFLIEALPEPLTPSDDHIQVFENYIPGSNLRLRSLRHPSTDERHRYIESVSFAEGGVTEISRLALTREDYEALRPLRGREIRKNVYRYEGSDADFDIEVFLGALWGLNLASVKFNTAEEASSFLAPEWFLLEATGNPAFQGPRLVDLSFEDVRLEFAKAKGEGN